MMTLIHAMKVILELLVLAKCVLHNDLGQVPQ